MMTTFKKNLAYLFTGVLICLIGGVGLWMATFMSSEVAPPDEVVITIKPGSSFNQIANQLERSGIIGDAKRFTWLAHWRDATGRIHAGEYLFKAPARPGDILARLQNGDIRKFQVTIPEGFNLKEIAARLADIQWGSADEILNLCYDDALLDDFEIEADSLEGYLFPETYSYTSSTTLQELLASMIKQLEYHLTPSLLERAKGLNLNRHELLTLASIIQKEAGNNAEMPQISAVFHNRLERGIALQADPTVIYGIAGFDGNLTRKHLKTPTPYNTYLQRGLPPGPIASPGLSALRAAANPEDSNALYFVARGDGTHEFNETLKAHNRAVQRYQLKK